MSHVLKWETLPNANRFEMRRSSPPPGTRAVIYGRVSSAEQAKSATNLPAQIDACRIYAQHQNLTVVFPPFVDTGAGNDMTRENFEKMISLSLQKPVPFDVIIVWDLDRFARSNSAPHILDGLKSRGVRIATVRTDYGQGDGSDFLRNIALLFAADLRRTLGANVSQGQKAAVRSGRYGVGGKAPFGYRVESSLQGSNVVRRFVPHAEESLIVRELFDRYDRGQVSISGLVAWLNESGVPTAAVRDNTKARAGTHGIWLHGTVWRMLKNPQYTGSIVYNRRRAYKDANGKWIDKRRDESEWIISANAHEALVSQERFDRVQVRLSSNEQTRPKDGKPKHFLLGVGKCAICGGPLLHENNGRHYYFYCRNRRRTRNKRFEECRGAARADFVLEEIRDGVNDVLTEPAMKANIAERISKYHKRLESLVAPDLHRLQNEIYEEQRKQRNLVSFIQGGDTSQTIRAALNQSEETLSRLQTGFEEVTARVTVSSRRLDVNAILEQFNEYKIKSRKANDQALLALIPQILASVAIDFTAVDEDDLVNVRFIFDEKNLDDLGGEIDRDLELLLGSGGLV